jgi:ribosomal protein L32
MVVRMRHTKSHTANRRSHHALTPVAVATDAKTGVPHMRHRVCLETGTYRGKKVIDLVQAAPKKKK